MKRPATYLFFDGNCGEAMRFYERVLGGTLSLMAAKDAPGADKLPPERREQILHARLEAGPLLLLASDWMSPSKYPGMSGFRVALTVAPLAEAQDVFTKLSEGGQVTDPFGKTFFSPGFGMFSDRFGTPWMIIAESADKK